MLKASYIGLVLGLTLQVAGGQEKQSTTPQIDRGRELFVKSAKGVACGTCHTMAGLGTAVGPDLKKLSSVIGPKGLVMTIRMTLTAYVQEVKSSQGTFAGILKQKEGDDIEIWDLSKMPPLLRKLKSNQVESMKQNEKWKHPPATAGYTPQELADIIGFLKWASTGSQKEVAIADLGVIE